MLDISDFGQGPKKYQWANIGADYDEFNPKTMRGYMITWSDGSVQFERFESIDGATAFAMSMAENVYLMSSVDNYAADKDRHATEGGA